EEDEEDMSHVEAPVQPNLASDHMDLLNSLLNQPGRAKNTIVLSRNLEPGTTCTSPPQTRDSWTSSPKKQLHLIPIMFRSFPSPM
ncbi:hypothetical protein IGI04_036363, partial [Brassica rapa subsp. trilocularis]